MTLSLRKAGLAAGAAVLMSATGASGAMAANDTISITANVLTVVADAGVSNGISVTNDGTNTYRVKDTNSSVSFVSSGSNVYATQISPREWSVTSLSGATITAVSVNAGDQTDAVSVAGLGINYLLSGGDGIDYLTGSSSYSGGALNGGNGNDHLTAGNANTTLHGNAGDDVINGGTGNDTLWGDSGNDTLNGGAGDDRIHAEGDTGTDVDSIDGGAGYDYLYADPIEGSEANVEFIS